MASTPLPFTPAFSRESFLTVPDQGLIGFCKSWHLSFSVVLVSLLESCQPLPGLFGTYLWNLIRFWLTLAVGSSALHGEDKISAMCMEEEKQRAAPYFTDKLCWHRVLSKAQYHLKEVHLYSLLMVWYLLQYRVNELYLKACSVFFNMKDWTVFTWLASWRIALHQKVFLWWEIIKMWLVGFWLF